MTQQVKSQRRKAYSMELAQLPVVDAQPGGRGPLLMDEEPQSAPVPSIRGLQLTQIVEFLDNTVRLPRDLRSFALYFGVLMTVAAGGMAHVLLSAQILQAEVDLVKMQAHHTVVERQNGELLWLIGRATNLSLVQDKAKAAGYRPIDERQFVEIDGEKVYIRDLDAEAAAASSFEPARPEQQTPLAMSIAQTDDRLSGIEPDGATSVTEPAEVAGLLQQWRAVLSGASGSPRVSEAPPSASTQELRSDGRIGQPAWIRDVVNYFSDLVAGVRGK